MSPFDKQIEGLTRKAVQAAEEGNWTTVDKLYRYRVESGLLEKVSSQMAEKLIKWDQWVMEKAKNVHAASLQQIHEIQDRRRKLSGLQRRWSGNTPDSLPSFNNTA